MTNKAASQLAHMRWSKLSPKERSEANKGKGQGRKRIYPQCPRYASHRFVNDRCPCGYIRFGLEKGLIL